MSTHWCTHTYANLVIRVSDFLKINIFAFIWQYYVVWLLSGPEGTHDKWLTAVPSIPKPKLASRLPHITDPCVKESMLASWPLSAPLTLHPTINFSNSWVFLPPVSHFYITLPLQPGLSLLSWFSWLSLCPLSWSPFLTLSFLPLPLSHPLLS